MKSWYSIGFLTIGLMILSSCSSTRYVPEGKFWLKYSGVKLENPDRHLSRTDFVNLQKQAPNDRLLGYPLRLKLYSSANIQKTNWWSKVMQKSGQPPVIFDSLYADQTVQQMHQYLVNKGYFNSEVNYVCDTLGPKSLQIVYDVQSKNNYRYRHITLDVKDDSLARHFDNWTSQSLIKTGESYDADVLNAERLRITRYLQNQGYYFFDKDHIEFLIDSALNENLMDVKMIVSPPKTGEHNMPYTYADVYIFPDEKPNAYNEKIFDTTAYRISKSRKDTTMLNYYFIHTQPLLIKPYVVASKLLIQPGDLYNLTNIDQTYENLLDLRIYRSTNIAIRPQSVDTADPKHVLNTIIEVRQELTHTWSTDFETSTSSGLQGVGANTVYQNKNLFGGAEIFSLRLRGLLEVQYLFNKSHREQENIEFINNMDVKLDAGIDFPRFIAPFNLRRTMQNRPRTLVNIGYSHQLRPASYNRAIVNTSFMYFWRRSRLSHTLSPLELNLVNINLTSTFAETLDNLSKNNNRLKYQYSNHFIFAARYAFSYSGQQNNRPVNFNAYRFSIESSGNSLFLVSNLIHASKNNDGYYQFFKVPYSQYIRIDGEFKRYWYLNSNHVLVTRLMLGGGFAYGNFSVLPYEKGFFAGGNNNIRAWPMNQLGPGSYYDPNQTYIERIGDIVGVGNIEYRFPIYGAFKGALFLDAGNIWLRDANDVFPNGEFVLKEIPEDIAVGGGFGIRWDLDMFIIRLDAAIPLRNPAKPKSEKWIIKQTKFKDIVWNFGIGYPF